MADLNNLNAIVTGCTGGLGTAIVQALAEAGAVVIGTDIAPDDTASAWREKMGENVSYEHLDVTSEGDWAALMTKIEADHGRLDILVHNAGVVVVKPLEQTTAADLRLMNSVNSEALLIGTAAALPLLRKSGERREFGASVVTISSTAGFIGAPLHIGYCTSKGAARLFSKACAIEFSARGFNIRCNSVHPGGIETPMVDHIMQRIVDNGMAESVEQARAATSAAVPLGRLAKPWDIAKAVRFLASDESGYMHGSEMLVDGGYVAQ